ncbi:MAG TPA: transglutaminase domain-containing protein [Verrucomicrobiae bacterium]|nr:transglutaminase domain-containing protein [Verrucomicrobiae bacterium]
MARSPLLPVLGIAALVLFAFFLAPDSSSHAQSAPPSRSFTFTYQVHVPATKEAGGRLLLWLPLPQQNEFQKISSLHIDSPVAHTEGSDPEYHNPYAFFEPAPTQLESGFDVTVHFVATRFEHRVDLASVSTARATNGASSTPPDLQRYLEPDKLVPLNGVIAELAKEHTAGDTTTLEKARHIYDYVVATMRYDKSGEGWGRGDAVWACTSKRGNCTDFHSLLIGMMRSSGIPARFEIGFPLPEGKSQGDIPGYHCWAEFYLQGTGWIPVDASEAWKNPAKRDYFFGAHDVNRVFFTYGRDIRLSPQQKGDPLNYFIYPYAELNGQTFKGLQTHFSFQDLAPEGVSAALR